MCPGPGGRPGGPGAGVARVALDRRVGRTDGAGLRRPLEAQRLLEHVLDPTLRDATWRLVLAERALVERDHARAAEVLAAVDAGRHDLAARRACQEASCAALPRVPA